MLMLIRMQTHLHHLASCMAISLSQPRWDPVSAVAFANVAVLTWRMSVLRLVLGITIRAPACITLLDRIICNLTIVMSTAKPPLLCVTTLLPDFRILHTTTATLVDSG